MGLDPSVETLSRTPLFHLHLRHGAKMVPFAGYEMPVQYRQGVLNEHLVTRASAGLFDISHMGQITVTPRSGDVGDAARQLESLIPVDIVDLAPGRQRYGFLTDPGGGILDDLMVMRLDDSLSIVVNAACKGADLAHLATALSPICDVTLVQRALIALQGPEAGAVLEQLAPGIGTMRFMDVRAASLLGASCVASRSGYTGEDGFEVSIPSDRVEEIVEALLADERVALVGLGARDSLRLEAGLCLYGSDIDTGTTPVEAGIAWGISRVRRAGGARAGGFPGADRILAEIKNGTSRRRVGLRAEGRTPVRAGAGLYRDETGTDAVGTVTSGGFGPSLGAPVAMGYVPHALSKPGTRLFAEVRGKRLPIAIAPLPFVKAGFSR